MSRGTDRSSACESKPVLKLRLKLTNFPTVLSSDDSVQDMLFRTEGNLFLDKAGLSKGGGMLVDYTPGVTGCPDWSRRALRSAVDTGCAS